MRDCLKFLKHNIMKEKCLDWNPYIIKKFEGIFPKVLLIGHDPRLQSSNTVADYALFANYFFEDPPKEYSEKQKYEFAKKSYAQILDITNKKYRPEEIYVTNLCNDALPHAPKGKTVLIPDKIAKAGVEHIKNILIQNNSIELVFPMSQQVNYWLQYFGLYETDTDFLEKAEPKKIGIDNNPQYYEAKRQRACPFLDICGNVYTTTTGQTIIPILHTKQYGKIQAYEQNYNRMRKYFFK